jgi:hypothetical protein
MHKYTSEVRADELGICNDQLLRIMCAKCILTINELPLTKNYSKIFCEDFALGYAEIRNNFVIPWYKKSPFYDANLTVLQLFVKPVLL